jgi:hypothetical protein
MKPIYLFSLAALWIFFACEVPQKKEEKKQEVAKVDKFTPETFSESDAPEEVKKLANAKIVGGAKWKDIQGEFLLVLVEFPIIQKPNPDAPKGSIDSVSHAEVQAYLFKNQKQIQRFFIVEAAPLDVMAKFITAATTLADADNNNIGEVTFLVKHHTRGDVSPSSLTLVTFTDETKFQMGGTMRVPHPKGSPMEKTEPKGMGGEKDDKGFRNAPDAIKKQADQIWDKFVEEDFETHFKN